MLYHAIVFPFSVIVGLIISAIDIVAGCFFIVFFAAIFLGIPAALIWFGLDSYGMLP